MKTVILKLLATWLGVFLLAAPAFAADITVTVTIYSDPAGATIYANTAEQRIGYAPMQLKYKIPSSLWKYGACKAMQPLKVRWASGAEAALAAVDICVNKGKKQELTFLRPAEVPGRDLDVSFALELQRIAAGQAASDAAASAAIIAAIPKPVHCSSYVVGSQVFTNCL